MTTDCLVELGTEELPPKALRSLSTAFLDLVNEGLAEFELQAESSAAFATPRRLAILLRNVPLQQADQQVEKRGPAVKAAYDAEGNPTRAALGFAASCGVGIDALEQRETGKGAWLYFSQAQAGRALSDILPEVVSRALGRLPIPKRMRWGDRTEEFVRPVKWLVMMLNDAVIDTEIFGLPAGKKTRGHRFHAARWIDIDHPANYEKLLLEQGKVMVNMEQRKQSIRQMVEQAAQGLGGAAHIEEDLLDEVTALVEYPVPVVGEFDVDFLEVPQEALVMTMQDNQKYFAVFDSDGGLMPHFITVSNVDSRHPEEVARGNERVIRPRFSDAQFFFEQDKKRGLQPMRQALDTVVFQSKLGTIGDKVQRMAGLANEIAKVTGADHAAVERAVQLCKADLMSDMVGEFPKLQGVMGRYYAQAENESGEICEAIEQHYWPRYAGDLLPTHNVGQCVALADRLDTLVGIFAIGQKPSGVKDPFALRRASLAILRILIEAKMEIDLKQLCQFAASQFDTGLKAGEAVDEVVDYVLDRLRGYYQDQDINFDVVDAVKAGSDAVLVDIDRRVLALNQFLQQDAAIALAAANKRIANILKKQVDITLGDVDPDLFELDEEKALHEQINQMAADVSRLFASQDYLSGLDKLAGLRPAVDQFFDHVMVMADDTALRDNRLALLSSLVQQFRQVADLSRLQS